MPIRERDATGPAHDRDRAEVLALQIVQFLLGDEDTANGFLSATGMSPEDLRAGINDLAFLGGVIDYLLEREPLLVAFCDSQQIDPTSPARLRHALP